MTNEEFLQKVETILREKGMTLYELQKKVDDDILKESTFYSMFDKRSVARIEYITEISHALNMSVGEMVDEKNKKSYLKPIEIEILGEFKDLKEEQVRRVLPIVKGIILAEKAKK